MKRLFDILFSLSAIVILALPLCLCALLVKWSSPGPAIYWSRRVGQNDNEFLMPKLRTMSLDSPELPTHELHNPERYITGFGRFLRRTSIDETPQFISILLGQMSVVGPRPMIPQYFEIIEARRKAGVSKLKPGLTGWAQINGRDGISTDEKLAFEIEYLKRRSLFFDLVIVFKTVGFVLFGKGIKH